MYIVCYREASNEQYEAYCQEVAADGADQEGVSGEDANKGVDERKKKDVQAMLQQLDDQAAQAQVEKPRVIVYQTTIYNSCMYLKSLSRSFTALFIYTCT